MANKITEFGFNFGSMDVTRTYSEKNGVKVVTLKTPKTQFSVRATKTGIIRFYDDQGNEYKLVNKDYLNQKINTGVQGYNMKKIFTNEIEYSIGTLNVMSDVVLSEIINGNSPYKNSPVYSDETKTLARRVLNSRKNN